MERLFSISEDLLGRTSMNFSRFLFKEISLSGKLTGIVGARGVGSTTLLLQIMKRISSADNKALYVNLEDFYFSSNSLLEFARLFYSRGGSHLFLDNLNKDPGFFHDLSTIYDEFPELKIYFSAAVDEGQPLLEILEEKAEIHFLPGLSFREFLELKYQFSFPVIEFDELLELNRIPGAAVLNRIRPLQYFEEYLREGYYPYAHVSTGDFQSIVRQMINNSLEGDLTALHHIDYISVGKIRQFLFFLANKGPVKPNIEKLANDFSTTRDSLLKFIKYLNWAGFINVVNRRAEGLKYQTKPDRLYLNNSNLINVISREHVNNGTIMETFLLNQLQIKHSVQLSENEGFLVDGKYHFEMDWKAASVRKPRQPRGDYQICESLEYQTGSRIPLWMFGFLY